MTLEFEDFVRPDFSQFKNLGGQNLDLYFWQTPFYQIMEDFEGLCVKVNDGDTISVQIARRDKPVVVRFNDTAAPELSEPGGFESRDWLKERCLSKNVHVLVDADNRVEKWGRMLGKVLVDGIDIGEVSSLHGLTRRWQERKDMALPSWRIEGGY